MPNPKDEKKCSEINTALDSWRQGDCVLGVQDFVWRINPDFPLSIDESGIGDLPEQEVPGFVVVTQTCDLVRPCDKRSFVEIVPLVEISAPKLTEIKKCRYPQYAYIPGVASKSLVADLDRVMTVEKSIVAQWERVPGWTTDEELRQFVMALNRKRTRFAFPDNFREINVAVTNIMKGKVAGLGNAGQAMKSLVQIRARAEPDWAGSSIRLHFWFIRNVDDSTFQGKSWDDLLKVWLDTLPKPEGYSEISGTVVTYEDITAKDYLESDELDLEHVS